MKKEFIPYEEALALKELGFDEPCFKGYTEEYKTLISFANTHTNTSVEKTLPTKPFTAPLYQQAFRWFRDKHNLVIVIQTVMKDSWLLTIESIDSTTASGVYNGKRWELDNYENYVDPKSYEEAELLCLKKLIEIVKKNNQ